MAMRTREPTTQAPDPRVALAAQGDRKAAQALLTELLPRIRNLVRYLIWSDADADDVVQVVLVELLRSFASYRGEGSLTAFCDRITVRVALHHARKKRTEKRRSTPITPELHLINPHSEGPDDYTLRRQTARYLDDLPDEQRQAVVLHHVVGQSVPELAETLQIPFETARSRLRLGMEKLRAKLNRRGES
ncbi:MAG TPA: RNA polymerase sigma factor [Polyangiales bacterium]